MDIDSLSSHSSDVTVVVDASPVSGPSRPAWHKEGEPMQLLSVEQEDGRERVTVCSKAKDYFINSIGNRPVAVVVVCGLYRTGKSYLLNLLSHHHNDSEEPGGADSPAFTVGATVNACTSGIWMWASSISNDKGPVYVLLDCEGSGNVEHDRDHDSILFALGTLLSGYFIYNSKVTLASPTPPPPMMPTQGVIDESAIQTLSVVTSLAQHIQNAQQDEVLTTAPHFLWVLRDFVLALEDQNHRPISAQEYLEIALSDKSSVAAYRSQESRDCREKLCNLFTHRDCIALVTPVIDEEKLQALDTVPYSQLREEFRDQVELLKTKVFRDCAPKTINNVPVTGIMFARLLDQYVHSINSNEIPKVGSVWQALQAQEGERVLGECSNEYRTLVRDRVKPNLPILEAELTASIKAIRLEVYSRFKKESLGEKKVVAQYKEQLKDLMDDVDKEIINSNEVMAREDCTRLLKTLWQPIAHRLDAYDEVEAYSLDEGIAEFTKDLSKLREAYQKDARGPTTVVMETYTKWMTPKQEKGLLELTRRQQEAAAQRAVMMERERAMERERERSEKELEERRAREQHERERYRLERTEKMKQEVKELAHNIEGIDTPSLVDEETDDSQRRMTEDIETEMAQLRGALDDRDNRNRRAPSTAACCRCTIM